MVTNWRLIESKNANWGELKPHWRFLLVDSPESNPKGCKESSRWSESAETTGNGILNWVAPRRGARTFDVAIFWVVTCIEIFATRRVSNLTKLLVLRSGTPSGCGHDERLFRWSPRTPTTGYFLATLRVALGNQ